MIAVRNHFHGKRCGLHIYIGSGITEMSPWVSFTCSVFVNTFFLSFLSLSASYEAQSSEQTQLGPECEQVRPPRVV